MAQQTAVEWLESKLDDLLDLYPTEWEAVNLLIVQAIEMEKEQIMDSFDKGKWDSMAFKGKSKERYYNETYGKQ